MTKKYILKPGSHQFVPGSAATHNNDNLTDEEAAWYLQRYPHIASLFLVVPVRVDDDHLDKKTKTIKNRKAVTTTKTKEIKP